MTLFLRLLEEAEKAAALQASCASVRQGSESDSVFSVSADHFDAVPGAPFSYWVSDEVRSTFRRYPKFESAAKQRASQCGLGTLDDFRFLRLFWELPSDSMLWTPYFDGGSYSPFYDDFRLLVKWGLEGRELKVFVAGKVGSASRKVQGETRYFSPGFVFPRRTKAFSPKFMPRGGIFSTAGQAGFAPEQELPAIVALMSSSIVNTLISLGQGAGGAPQFEVGLVKRLPWPEIAKFQGQLDSLAREAWALVRAHSWTDETSRSFLAPPALVERVAKFDANAIRERLLELKEEIDRIALNLYGLPARENEPVLADVELVPERHEGREQEDSLDVLESLDSLICWATGVAFGRFDWRLATGEREPPPEPEPFDPLPDKSPGMLPDGDEPFHAHDGILVDDRGHPHDLPRLIDDLLTRVEVEVPTNLRRWLRKEFFPHHLKQYSKSRRKAPIYWPLSTVSGDYTLWIYYPALTSQTLYTAVNDFVDPKLKDVAAERTRLRQKGADRSSADEDRFAGLSDFEAELQELRTTLLETAERYRPNQDDGVQITAAPLWPLFRHKPWQKLLKETWEELKEGKYDWAHLAMAYWPHRVVRTAHTDRSIAIAHDLEDELWHEVSAEVKRGKTKTEWQPRELSESELDRIAERFK